MNKPQKQKAHKVMLLKNFWSESRTAVLAKITSFHVAEISKSVYN